MAIDPTAVGQLVQAGGWTLFVFQSFVIAVAVHRKWLVPGWVYGREVARTDKLDRHLKALTAALKRLAAAKKADG